MSLRVSSAVPFPISLSTLSLTDLTSGWALTSSSSDGLEAEPHEMATGDIYAAYFTLCTPVATGLSSIGALCFRCQRLPEDEEGGAGEPGRGPGVPAAVREIMHAERAITHPLPRLCVCSRMVEAWFQAPAQVALGESATVALKLESCIEEQLSVRVGIAAGSSGAIVGDAFKDVWLKAGEAGEVGWEVSAEEVGVLDLFGSVEVLVGRASDDLDAAGPAVAAGPDQGLDFALSTSVFVRG